MPLCLQFGLNNSFIPMKTLHDATAAAERR
jgi:hypothetical protein